MGEISLQDRRLKGLRNAITKLDNRKIKSINIITKDFENEDDLEGHKVSFIPLYKFLLEKI